MLFPLTKATRVVELDLDGDRVSVRPCFAGTAAVDLWLDLGNYKTTVYPQLDLDGEHACVPLFAVTAAVDLQLDLTASAFPRAPLFDCHLPSESVTSTAGRAALPWYSQGLQGHQAGLPPKGVVPFQSA